VLAREAVVVQSARSANHDKLVIFDGALKGAFTVESQWFYLLRLVGSFVALGFTAIVHVAVLLSGILLYAFLLVADGEVRLC
jgi:hypothetical protein